MISHTTMSSRQPPSAQGGLPQSVKLAVPDTPAVAIVRNVPAEYRAKTEPLLAKGTMRPKKHETTGEEGLFRARLDKIIHTKHELVQLAGKLDWDWLDGRDRAAPQRQRPARGRDSLRHWAALV